MGWELWGFLGVEGLDMRIYGEIRRKNLREWGELALEQPPGNRGQEICPTHAR